MRRSVAALAAGIALVTSAASGAPEATPRAPRDPGGVVRVPHRDPAALPAKGPTNALVTIEVFFTPMPASQRQSFRYLEKLQEAHPSRVRIVYRVVKGSFARFPYAALHAHSEGKFFEFLDALQGAPRALDDKALLEIGKRVGLDSERMQAAITRPPAAYDKLLDTNQRRLRRRTRQNTTLPTVLVNGTWLTGFSTIRPEGLESAYLEAKDAAEELLDRGVTRAELASAFDQIISLPDEIDVRPGATDEELEEPVSIGRLATPPLSYAGLPSHGAATAPLTIAVLCSPRSTNCAAPLSTAQRTADLFPDQVRVVWAPFYELDRDDAAELSILADAALCAERDGGRAIDRDDTWDPADSPGWRWVKQVLVETASRVRWRTVDEGLDRVVEKLRVEPRAFATCRAQIAGTSIAFIEAARQAGVRSTPATIVNGRIYGPITDPGTLQLLVEAELAPGLLSPAWSHPELVPSR